LLTVDLLTFSFVLPRLIVSNDDIVYESKSLGILKDVKQEKEKKPAQQAKAACKQIGALR
jgi:hypothetical protein